MNGQSARSAVTRGAFRLAEFSTLTARVVTTAPFGPRVTRGVGTPFEAIQVSRSVDPDTLASAGAAAAALTTDAAATEARWRLAVVRRH